jgi:hypothetical protein
MIQPEAETDTGVQKEFPMYREVAWDYENSKPIYKSGLPVIIEGAAAIKVWAWKALRTVRYRYEMHTWDYGNEVESLIGQPYSQELKESEAARYVKECLEINPYITDVKDISVAFSSDRLTVRCTLVTIYGEVDISV